MENIFGRDIIPSNEFERVAALKFYASAPLITPDGFAIGVLAIVDTKPREFTSEQIQSLRDLADLVMKEIENRNILDAF